LGEQKALAAGRAIVDLSDRAVLTVSGVDRLTWLDSLTSQSVAGLVPGESAETLLLDPTGRLQYAIRLVEDGDTTWLLVDAAEAPPLLAWLDRMRFMLRVEVADRSADFATLGALAVPVALAAPAAPAALAAPAAPVAPVAPFASGTEGVTDAPVGRDPEHPLDTFAAAPNGVPLVWVDPWRAVVTGGHQYATAAEHPGAKWFYREVLVDRALVDGAVPPAADGDREYPAADALAEFPAAGTLALEALRIAAWRPRLGSEADEKTIPHELDWLRSAVHLNKGCYRGQETVAKVHNLGHPPRRLVMLHLDGSEGVLPPSGAEVLRATAEVAIPAASAPEVAIPAEAAVPAAIAPEVAIPADIAPEAAIPAEHLAAAAIGRVTSSALHYELGPIALAVIKRNVPTEAALVVRTEGIDIAAAQEVIVPPGAGAEANVPRLPRLGAVTR